MPWAGIWRANTPHGCRLVPVSGVVQLDRYYSALRRATKDLNTPLSLGIMGFVIAHYVGIKTKGFKAYIKEYFEPFIIMMPLNLIGEVAKIVSISFVYSAISWRRNHYPGGFLLDLQYYTASVSERIFRIVRRRHTGFCVYHADHCIYIHASKVGDYGLRYPDLVENSRVYGSRPCNRTWSHRRGHRRRPYSRASQ